MFYFLLFLFLFQSIADSQNEDIKPHEKVSVVVRLIEVYVLDKEGSPLNDLAENDFSIYVDGDSQPIIHFEKGKNFLTIFNLTSNKVKNQQHIGEVCKKGRNFILFFDFSNNLPQGIKRIKEATLHFIKNQLTQEDKITIISYSLLKGIRTHILNGTPAMAEEFINKIGLKNLISAGEMFEILANREGELTASGPPVSYSDRIGEISRISSRFQLIQFCSSMTKLAQALRLIEGVKHIILFSTGPMSELLYGKGFSFFDSPHRLTPNWQIQYVDKNLSFLWDHMAREFVTSNCYVYSINTEGIIPGNLLSSGYYAKGEEALKRLSQLTGGKYYPNTEDLKPAVEDIAKRTSFYYVLGIPVKEEMDGKFHKIEVKVKRKGVKVHAPTGYYNPKPFKEYTDFEKFLHLVDFALSERPLLQELKEFPLSLTPIDREKNIFEISFEIPLKELLEGNGGIEVVTIFFDSKKDIIKMKRVKVEDISKAERFNYKRVIEIPLDTEEVRVIVRNLSTGRSLRGIAKKE